MLLPTLSKARSKGEDITCLNNLRRLQTAWFMYADDGEGRLVLNAPGNPDGGPPLGQWLAELVCGLPSGANTNRQYLTEGRRGAYTVKTLGVYKCPADKVACPIGPRVRSVSMNTYLARVGRRSELSVPCLEEEVRPLETGVDLGLSGRASRQHQRRPFLHAVGVVGRLQRSARLKPQRCRRLRVGGWARRDQEMAGGEYQTPGLEGGGRQRNRRPPAIFGGSTNTQPTGDVGGDRLQAEIAPPESRCATHGKDKLVLPRQHERGRLDRQKPKDINTRGLANLGHAEGMSRLTTLSRA